MRDPGIPAPNIPRVVGHPIPVPPLEVHVTPVSGELARCAAGTAWVDIVLDVAGVLPLAEINGLRRILWGVFGVNIRASATSSIPTPAEWSANLLSQRGIRFY